MAILDILNSKIEDLKHSNSTEIDNINKNLETINLALEAVNDEEKLIEYNFDVAINLVDQNTKSFGIIDYKKCISDVKNSLIIKKRFVSTLSLSEKQQHDLKCFKDRLEEVKKSLEKSANEYNKPSELLDNLEKLKNAIDPDNQEKDYNFKMIEAFIEAVDYENLSYRDIQELVSLLEVTKDISNSKTDIREIINLFRSFYDRVDPGLFYKYKDEICSRIDMDNTKKILEFFKEEKIIDKFSLLPLVTIALYGRFEFVRDFYHERVLPKKQNIKSIYFLDDASCLWINEASGERKYPAAIRVNDDEIIECPLYASIHNLCDDDLWENVRLITENKNIFTNKLDLENMDNMWVLMKDSSFIKKNIELFKQFGFQNVKIPALVIVDLEEKIHLATELGLLNSPRNTVFNEIERAVPRFDDFELIGKKRNISILNYYQRNISRLATTSYNDYIYWFYKIQNSSKEDFYKLFFSSKKAGTKSPIELIDDEDKGIVYDNNKMNNFINDNFIVDYSPLIDNYSLYTDTIREYNNSPDRVINPYYDKDVLDEEEVNHLEDFVSNDDDFSSGRKKIVRNEYVYVFGNIIVSRYKALRNLTALKKKFGYIDHNMLLTAVVYGSYFNKDIFEEIRDSIKGDELKI